MGYLHRRCRQANAAVSGKGRPYMPDPLSDERDMERLCSRLYTALALQALIADEVGCTACSTSCSGRSRLRAVDELW